MLRYLGIRSKFRLYFNYDEDLWEIEAYMSYKNKLKLVLSDYINKETNLNVFCFPFLRYLMI